MDGEDTPMTQEQVAQQVAEQAKIQEAISTADDIKCERCGNYTFQEVMLFKRISAIMSPSGKEGIVPIPTMACDACGNVNQMFLPEKSPVTAPPSGLKLDL